MKKTLLTMLLFAVVSVLLTACTSTSTINETQIRNDLESRITSLDKNEKVVEVSVEKRETNLDEKRDVIRCNVTTEDNICRYEKSIFMMYNLNEDDSWILNDFSVNSRSEWTITPLKGVSEDNIVVSLNGISVTAENEIWNVTQDNVKIVSIDKHETDLEAKTDKITATVTVDDIVEEASGQLVINYKFNNGTWEIDSMSGNESFAAAMKPGFALNVNDELLLNALNEQSFDYGLTKDTLVWFTKDLQTIFVKKNEINDFKIESQESHGKGTQQVYLCCCILTKTHAQFTLNMEIVYDYNSDSGDWDLEPFSIDAKCTSATIEGTWTGTYSDVPYAGTCQLEITEIAADGTINAIYSYNPEVTSEFSEAGSYYVSGTIDLTTLLLTLIAGDWIDEPFYDAFMKSDIIAQLYVEDSTLSGYAQHGNPFIVAQ